MISVLSLMVLILADGSEDRTLMTSHRCRLDLLWVQSMGPTTFRTRDGVEIVEFQCRPFRMEAQS